MKQIIVYSSLAVLVIMSIAFYVFAYLEAASYTGLGASFAGLQFMFMMLYGVAAEVMALLGLAVFFFFYDGDGTTDDRSLTNKRAKQFALSAGLVLLLGAAFCYIGTNWLG